MLPNMTPMRIRLTPLAGYLLTLSIYSGFMFLNTVREQQLLAEVMDDSSVGGEQDTVGALRRGRRHTKTMGPPTLTKIDDFFNWLEVPETTCRKTIRFGGSYCRHALDYDKDICFDDDVAIVPNDCNVYSFGIGSDSTFDDASNHYGCQVYMFDPTIDEQAVKKTILGRQQFFHYGLESHHKVMDHKVSYIEDNQTEIIVGIYDTYDSIRETLGHQDLEVHYLKIDIDAAEWRVLPYLTEKGLLTGVRQIAMEIHTMEIIKLPQDKIMDKLREFAKILTELRKAGFLRVSYRPTVVIDTLYHVPGENRTIPTCGDVLFVKREGFK